MKLLPYESFTVVTHDSIPVVTQRLSAQVARSRWFAKQPYSGRVWRDGFKVMPVIGYRNSFLPVIRGYLDAAPDGTIIHVTMRLHYGVAAFMYLWCCVVGVAFVEILESILAGSTPWAVLLAPLFMLTFAVGLTLGGFWFEAPARREEITRLLIGTEPARGLTAGVGSSA